MDQKDNSRLSPHNIEHLDKQFKALKLRRAAHTYEEIGEIMGCSMGTAYRYVSEAMKFIKSKIGESADEVRQIELDKLARLEGKLHRAIDLDPPNEELVKLIGQCVKVSESMRKLTGMDAPMEVKHSGPHYTVEDASPNTKAWPDAPTQAPVHEDKIQEQSGCETEPEALDD